MRPMTILYEDQADGPIQNFGPHIFVVQCICDRVGGAVWDFKDRIHPVPLKGNSNVRESCKSHSFKAAKDGRAVFAVYDSDQIRGLPGLAAAICKTQIKDILLGECPWRKQLKIVLLEKNIESVIDAICECDKTIVQEETWINATKRKRLNARDLILKNAAFQRDRAFRDAVLVKVPSFCYLIDKLVAVYNPAPPTN